MNDKEIRTIADLMATLSPEEQERIEREVKKIGKKIESSRGFSEGAIKKNDTDGNRD